MPEFNNKEEYEKWKAEKLKSNIDRIQSLREEERLRLEKLKEEEKQSKLWVCPACLNSNDISQIKCQCGYTVDEMFLEYCKGNLTPVGLLKGINEAIATKNNKLEVFLSHYLLKRFSDSAEAEKTIELIDSYSKQVICGKCGANNFYNPIYFGKDKCERCGEWLHQYIKSGFKSGEPIHVCPVCSGTEVKKVSFIYESGTTEIYGGAVGTGIGFGEDLSVGGGVASIKGKTQTLLAQKLTPPKESSGAGIGCFFLIIIFIIFIIINSIILKLTELLIPAHSAKIVTISFLVTLGIGFFKWSRIMDSAQKNAKLKYQKDSKKWNNSWICNSCGHIFIPSEIK
jgi:rubrerythrin